MTEYTCPDCGKEMAIIFVGDGTAYDECECGTQSLPYYADGSGDVESAQLK